MAQLKDLIVNGATRLIGDVFTNKIQITAISAPTASNGTTYGPGTSGQVLKSNGTNVYWAADDNSQTVTGVKGNSESSYRTGNVNLTPANLGAVNKAGDTMIGPLAWNNSTALPQSNGLQYILGITAFSDGGQTQWQAASSVSVGSATTATNLASAPSLATSGTTQITVTAGGKTSSAYTIPYATSAGSVALSGVTGADDLKAIEALTGTSGLLKKTAANTWTLDTTAYTTNTGTVTKVTAGTGLSIGTTSGGNFTTTGTINHTNSVTAQTTQALYPIKIDAQGHISAYGSAVTSLPASDVSAWAKASTKPSYALSEITGADDVKAIEGLTGTSGILKKTAANTWTLDTTAYTTNTGTVTTVTAGTGLNTSADQADSATKGSITTTGTLYLTKSGATAGSYGPSAAVTGSHGTTMDVPYVTVDTYGRVTSISNKVYTAQDTWRGIQDNLTSSTNTTESLSAKQGYLLANGDARDDTKLPLTGGILSGSLWSGTTSDTAEHQVGVASGAGTIYMYAHSGSTGNRGIYTQNAAGTYSNVITVDQSNNVILYGSATKNVLKAGDTMSGQLIVDYNNTSDTEYPIVVQRNKAGTSNAGVAVQVKNSGSGLSVSPMIGAGGSNHGLWSSGYYDGTTYTTDGKWIVYRNNTGAIMLNGHATSANTAVTATQSKGWEIINGNELSTTKPASATTLYINYRFSNGTQGALVDGYRFCNGNGATTRVAASIFNTTRRGTGTPSGGADGDIYFQYS